VNEKIFIIDDEETLCYFLKESLEEKGYKVTAAHTVADGLDFVTKQQTDVVLLDLKLPDGDGLDVLREIRKVDSNLPVIVLTGHAAVESAVQAMKLGAYDYLEKPINLAELSTSVAQALQSSSQARRTVKEQEREIEFERAQPRERAVESESPRVDRFAARELAAKSRMVRHLERQLEEVATLDSISSELLRSLELDEVTGRAMDRLLELPSVDMIAVFVAGHEGKELVLAGQRRFPPHVWEDTAQRRLPTEGVLGRSLSHLPSVLPLADAGPDPWIDELGARLGDGILLLLLPLRDGEEVRGLMLVGRRDGRPFDRTQIQMLATMAERLALGLGRAILFGSLRGGVIELSKRQALLDRVLQGISDGLVVVGREGKVRLVNRAGERLLGCKEEEVLGRPVEDVLGFGAEIVRDSLETGLAYSGEEIVVKRDKEEGIPLGMSISPLRGDGGDVNGAVVMLGDLRETRALEEERRKLDRQVFLGEISAVMAHEIRNPLAGMGAGIQHLQTKFEEGDERHEALGRILREGERVNRIIEDILLISRPPHLNLAPCDISEVIGEVVREWEAKAREAGVEISEYTASGLPLVNGDKVRLHQALSNLVSNGIEAMPDGGELTIGVTGPRRPDLPDSAERADSWRDGDYVEVEITDTGVGIREEDLGRIFQPFNDMKARGTGLELAISKRIINEHGGEVEVQSQEEKGTRFIVRVPLARRGGR
jgi:PAS domain S-box-containing protein